LCPPLITSSTIEGTRIGGGGPLGDYSIPLSFLPSIVCSSLFSSLLSYDFSSILLPPIFSSLLPSPLSSLSSALSSPSLLSSLSSLLLYLLCSTLSLSSLISHIFPYILSLVGVGGGGEWLVRENEA
jgi:hypothetical protein